jgi:PKD repeat protein
LDLVLKDISFSYPNGRIPVKENFNISVKIENTASINFNDTKLYLLIKGPSIDITDFYTIDELPPQKAITFDIMHYPLLIIGQYKIVAFIDAHNIIKEMNEDNNLLSSNITVVNRPIAVLEANQTKVYVNDLIMFSAGKSSGDAAILEYVFNFGDGSDIATLKTTNKITHSYAKKGDYYVTLRVRDIHGLLSSAISISISVEEREKIDPVDDGLPSANFTVLPKIGNIFTNFKFISYSNPLQGSSIKKYLWDFGDGTIIDWKTPYHRYTNDGIYTVSFRVMDSEDRYSPFFNITLEVKNIVPSVNLQVVNNTIYEGEPMVFNASLTTDVDDTLTEPGSRFIWYFGDSANTSYMESSIHFPDGKFDMITEFTYSKPGDYTVTLVVYDDDNSRNMTTLKITVLDLEDTNGDDSSEEKFDQALVFGLFVFGIILIITFLLLFLFYRKRKSTKSTKSKKKKMEKEREQLYSDSSNEYGPGSNGIIVSDAAYSEESVKGKSKSGKKAKDNIEIKKTSTNTYQPPAVEVILPDEKVVDWKDGLSEQEHVLSLSEVTIVSDQDLLHADMITVNDNGETTEFVPETETEVSDEEVEFIEEFEPEEDAEGDWEEYVEVAEFKPVRTETFEEVEGPEFELEEDAEIEPDMKEETGVEDDGLVFEFEEDGETKSETVEAESTTPEYKAIPHEKHKIKKPKEKLIPIPGVGFVKRSELQQALGIDDSTMESIRSGDLGYGDIPIKENVPIRVDSSGPSESGLRCKNCFTPIKGKFIKVRRKETDGSKIAVVGPFCSPGCAAKFQNE